MTSKYFYLKKKKVVGHLQIIYQEEKEVKSHCLNNSPAFTHPSLVPKHKAILALQPKC